LDICCGSMSDCPEGFGCATGGSPCSTEWEGYCEPIPPAS
jgi:hypothetical protein